MGQPLFTYTHICCMCLFVLQNRSRPSQLCTYTTDHKSKFKTLINGLPLLYTYTLISSMSIDFLLILAFVLLQMGCPRTFTRTTRMNPGVHQVLLEKVRPFIERKKTNFREPISAEERLSITIRYLTRGKYLLNYKENNLKKS